MANIPTKLFTWLTKPTSPFTRGHHYPSLVNPGSSQFVYNTKTDCKLAESHAPRRAIQTSCTHVQRSSYNLRRAEHRTCSSLINCSIQNHAKLRTSKHKAQDTDHQTLQIQSYSAKQGSFSVHVSSQTCTLSDQ